MWGEQENFQKNYANVNPLGKPTFSAAKKFVLATIA
jgi:hypothetical protein